MPKIEDATLKQIAALMLKAEQDLTSFSFAVRIAVPELLKRLEQYETPPVEPDIKPTPVPGHKESATDLYDAGKFEDCADLDSVNISSGMTQKGIADIIEYGIKSAKGKPLRVNVSGKVSAIYLGGGHKHAINTEELPLGDIELYGLTEDAEICGLKFGSDKGGVNREIRLSGGVAVSPHANPDGTGMGDKAAIHVRDHGTGLKLVITPGSTCRVDPTWEDYDRMGCKWMIFGSDFELVVDADDLMPFCDPCREHSFYLKNMRSVFVEGAWNAARVMQDAAGDEWLLGNGRTFAQHTNRPPAEYPKGGPASTGRIVFKDCVATRCGWEGQLATMGADMQVIPGNPKAGGGSDFTCSGHTGIVYELRGCESLEGYAGAVACWSEQVHTSESAQNPDGYRCWMFDDEGAANDPALVTLASDKWSTKFVDIKNFSVSGERTPEQRPAFLLSGTEALSLESLSVFGESIHEGSEHLRLNHQSGATPIAHMNFGGNHSEE